MHGGDVTHDSDVSLGHPGFLFPGVTGVNAPHQVVDRHGEPDRAIAVIPSVEQ